MNWQNFIFVFWHSVGYNGTEINMNRDTLIEAALPVMRRLHDLAGETVGLAVLDSKAGKGLIVESVQGMRHRFSFTLTPGTHFPFHTGAPAKAILAFLPEDKRKHWLKRSHLKQFTPQTITTKAAFVKELQEIKRCGYALDRSEEIEGCHCVSAPIFDRGRRAIAAIWITGPSSRLSIDDLHKAAPDVIRAAGEVSDAIGRNATENQLSPNDDLVRKTMRHLESHLEQKVDWHELSRQLGASYSKLRHLFAEQTGVPPSRYHLNLRIAEAKRLLRESDLSVHAIAEKTGFSDPNHFSAMFSRKVGISPSRYRDG